ncbi:MAG TPA: response regulator transcription factor, partial [Candidatus Dormibacteraeota bacterium]|nr:response regulator transcription factor [Candidatus Dormibacteraeota bacterium]
MDDHWVVRQGLRMFLDQESAITVVGEASDGSEAIELVRRLRPDVVLMDILMPHVDGIEAIARIKAEMPRVQVIALTSVLQGRSVSDAIQAGAIGYLIKDTKGDELVRAIRDATEGRVHLSPEAATRLAKDLRQSEGVESLTERETSVLRLVAEGMANKEIARRLSISEKTVKAHLNNVFTKLDVHSRTQAALQAIRSGIA